MKPTKAQFSEAIAKIEKFSPAPRILAKAMTMLRNPNSSIDDIAVLIRSDAALAAQIIRSANSAFYGSSERVSSLDLAVQKIGFREGIRLLNLAAMKVMSARGLDNYGIAAEAFWAESLFNGLFIEELAKQTGAYDPDEAHTAGLLRFIGRLAINQSIEELGTGMFWNCETSLETWVLEQVGFSQGYAGAILLRAWKFSEPLAQALEWQHEPERCPAPNWLAEALHFASAVVPQGLGVTFATSEPPLTALPDTNFVRQNNLTVEMTTELLTVSRVKFEAISKNL